MNSVKRTREPRGGDGDRLRHFVPVPFDSPGHPTVTYHCPEYPAGHLIPMHRHLRGQLLYAVSGIMAVVTRAGTWTVPPQQAVWIPPETEHEVRIPCAVSMRSLYIHPESVEGLPNVCRVVQVTPLLRELIAQLVAPSARSQHQVTRLMAVLVDEVMMLESPPLHLPVPQDGRLCSITDRLLDDPADSRGLGEWSRMVGASERTLARLFIKETGMGFRDWRQRLRMLTAIERLAASEDVTSVALDIGYGSSSAFIAMFKRLLGETPGRFIMRERSG